MLFDDVVGSAEEMYSDYTGELLAINEFNEKNLYKKISSNKNLQHLNIAWKINILFTQFFDHKRYNEYIDPDEQIEINKSIKLKS